MKLLKQNNKIQLLLFFILLLGSFQTAFAQTIGDYRTKATGNWNALGSWERLNSIGPEVWAEPTALQGYPGQNAIPALVTIIAGYNITCNVTISGSNRIGSLAMTSGASSSSLTITSVNSLVVNSNITMAAGGGARTINVGTAFLSCGSISISDTGNDLLDAELSVSTGGIFVNSNLSMAGSALRNAVRFTGSGTLSCGGNLTGGTIVASTGTVKYDGSGAQSVGAYAFNNLTLGGSGVKTINALTTISGGVAIEDTASASLNAGTNYNVNALILGVNGRLLGTWGSTTSSATNTNNTYFAATTGFLTVAKSTPDITATIGSYTYTGLSQGPNTATNTGTGSSYTYSYRGVSPTVYAASATPPINAGTYRVTATITADGDFVARSTSATDFTIVKRNLTISGITANNRAYNGLSTATISGTAAYVDLQNSESFSVTGTPVFSFANATVGSGKTVTVTGYTAPSTNYTITQPTGLTADITQAPLTITATDGSKQFAATYTVGSGSILFTSTGLQNSETIGSITTASTGAVNTAETGTYPIVPSAATGGTFTASNYNITYTNGTLTVTSTTGHYRSKATGTWTNLNTWERWDGDSWETPTAITPEGYPGQFSTTSFVYLKDSFNITLNISIDGLKKIGRLEMLEGPTNTTLSFNSGFSLVVNANVIINSGGGNKTIAVGAGFLSCGQIAIRTTPDASIDSEITLSTGAISVFGNIAMAGASDRNAMRVTGDGSISLTGNITGGTLYKGTGIVTFNSASNQTIGSYEFYDLALTNAGTKTLNATTTIVNNLRIASGVVATLPTTTPTPTTYNVNTLTLACGGTVVGTWGHTNSTPSNPPQDTIFSTSTGKINVATDSTANPPAVVTVTQPTCSLATGTITVTLQNARDTYGFDDGVNPLTYQTSNSKSGLALGNYNVFIKRRSGCTTTATPVTLVSATKTWTGTTSNDWNTASNWNPAGVPTDTNCISVQM